MSKHYEPLPCYAPLLEFLLQGATGNLQHMFTLPNDGYTAMAMALREAKCFAFEFSDWQQPREQANLLAQFSADCMTAGVFQPPFDVTLLQWNDAPWVARPEDEHKFFHPEKYPGVAPDKSPQWAVALIMTLMRHGKGTPLCDIGLANDEALKNAPGYGEKDATLALVFGLTVTQDKLRFAILQDMSILASYNSGLAWTVGNQSPWPAQHLRTYNILRREFWEPRLGRDPEELIAHDGAVTMRNVFYYLSALSSRGPQERKVVPRPEIVARREREKKAPWVSYSVISLPGLSEAAPGPSRAGHKLDGTRASPRVHWRRGHPRHLASGRVVAIPPMLVGVSELGEVIASYHVK